MNEGPNKNDPHKNDRSIDSKKEEYIITPRLHFTVKEFIAHYKVAENQPIMVIGDTGVGKSMFLEIYEKFYEERCKKNGKKPNVVWANCAHFGDNHSDFNMTKSELFGNVKGAFTGAINDKKGLVEIANKGLLILEEIGELPKQVQAMLLTFIETGKYRKVGSTKLESSKVQIIGATNNEGKLREDFRYRFLPFYIPSLHERREDVFYYIGAKFPELIKTLNSSEVLALLAYHWPGNVREVHRVARLMLREKEVTDNRNSSKPKNAMITVDNRLSDRRFKSIDGLQVLDIMDWASSWGGDVFLESYLKKYGLDLSVPGTLISHPFGDLDGPTVINLISAHGNKGETKAFLESFKVRIVPRITAFDRAWDGYTAFCGFFGQNANKNVNILNNLKKGEIYFFTQDLPDGTWLKRVRGGHFIVPTRLIPRAEKSKCSWKISDPANELPKEIYDFWSRLEEQVNSDILKDSRHGLENQKNHDKLQDSDCSQNNIDIFKMSYCQLSKFYYEGLLNKTGGRVKDAARMAGLHENTFRSRLNKLGIPFLRKDISLQ